MVGTLWPAPYWPIVPAMVQNVQTGNYVFVSAARAASTGALLNTSYEVFVGNTRHKCFLYLYITFCTNHFICLFVCLLTHWLLQLFHCFCYCTPFICCSPCFKFARHWNHMYNSQICWFRSPHSWYCWQTHKHYHSPIWKIITKYQQTKSWVDTEIRYDMLLLNSIKFYYKYKRDEVPDYFASFNLHTQGSFYDYNTHQRDDIRTNRVPINLTK